MSKKIALIISLIAVFLISGCANTQTSDSKSGSVPKDHYSVEKWFSLPKSFENQFPAKAQEYWKNENPFLKVLSEQTKTCNTNRDCTKLAIDVMINIPKKDISSAKHTEEAYQVLEKKFDPICSQNACYYKYNYVLVYNYIPSNLMTEEADYN